MKRQRLYFTLCKLAWHSRKVGRIGLQCMIKEAIGLRLLSKLHGV
jgi:hypothetical protein